MTDLEPLDLTADEARALVDDIRADAEVMVPKVRRAFEGRAWRALGYASWDELRAAEFPAIHVAIEGRPAAVHELREAGMSQRQIGAALGVSEGTVRNDMRQPDAQDYASDRRTAMSGGREYTRAAPERAVMAPEERAEVVDGLRRRAAELEDLAAQTEAYARLDNELDEAMDGTAVRFRRNWSIAVRHATEVWSFDADRLAEVYATDFDASIDRAFLVEMERFIDRVREARRRNTSGLRVIKGARAS